MSVSTRIKEVRKAMKMSRDVFGEKLGVSRDVIANIELDRLANPEHKEPVYKLICSTFNVSYEWLTTGQGDMYVESQEAYFDTLAEQYGLGFYARKVLDFYGSLDVEQKNTLEILMRDFVYSVIETEAAADEDAPPSPVDNVIERIDLYRAADSKHGTEHEIIKDGQDTLDGLTKIKGKHIGKKEDF